MRKIIIDTNFLLIPAQFKVDIFSEFERICNFPYELCIVDKTVDELKKLINSGRGRDYAAAKLGLKLLEEKKVKYLKTETLKNVDELIVGLANKVDFAVATQDKALMVKLKKKSVPLINLRQKSYLIIDSEGKDVL